MPPSLARRSQAMSAGIITPPPPPPPPPLGGSTAFDPDTMFCGACCDNPHTALDSDGGESWQSLWMQSIFVMEHEWKAPHHARVVQSLVQPLEGVNKVWMDDKDASLLYIEHSVAVSTTLLVEKLKQGGYPATWQASQEVTDMDELLLPKNTTGTDNTTGEPVSTVRTTLYVQGLCCSTEVPSVRKVLKGLSGIGRLAIQPTTARVLLDHDPTQAAPSAAADALTRAGFPTTVLSTEDPSQATAAGGSKRSATMASTTGRSTLHATAVLHSGDVVPIQHAAAAVPGVHRIGVAVAESVVYVEHDWSISPITVVMDKLTRKGYPTTLVQDAQAVAVAQQSAQLIAQPRSKYVESTLAIPNLTQGHVALLAKAVKQHFIRAQVRALHPHVSSRTVKVEHNPELLDIELLAETLRPYGLDVIVVTDGHAEQFILPLVEDEDDKAAKAAAAYETSGQLSLSVIGSGIFWVLSLFSYIGNARDENDGFSDLDDSTKSGHGAFYYFEYFGLLAVVLGLPPVAVKAARTIKRKEFDSNCMMVTAAIGALLLGEWDEAASVAFLFSVSEYLERRATERARRALTQIANLRPDYCHWIHPETQQIWVVPAAQVPVGSWLSVRTGDKIAADGFVVRGTSQVDESSLTGESVPIRKGPNDTVQGGSINIGSTPIVVQTTSSVADSTVSRLIRLVEDAQTNTSETEKMIDSFARAYTPAVVAIASVLCTVPWLWGIQTGQEWCLRGLILIVIACPCALTISTPVTYAAGLAATAQRGIIIKGGAYLEALGHVRTVLLDKTGTLTEGKFQIMELTEIGETRSRAEMLGLMALLEASSSHPLSAALVKAAAKEGVQVPTELRMEDHTILKGEGVTAVVEGKQVYVGNQRLFDRLGMYMDLPKAYKSVAENWQSNGASVGFVGVEREGIIGFYCVTDAVRPEAADAVTTLQIHGLRVEMLTGDGDGAAIAVASQIGLPNSAVHAKLLPEDKLHLVGRMRSPPSRRFLQRNSTVLFCGDGVNDGPALAVADVGVAMGEGASSLATEVSDVSLMDNNLHKLVDAIFMGQRVVSTIMQNIGLSLAGKVVVVILTMAGRMTLLGAIASDVGVMLVVTLNGMRLLPSYSDVTKQERHHASQRYDAVPLVGNSPTGVAELDDSYGAGEGRYKENELV
uniref:HMA domain-containing protein n=1 Tax=Amphora coffeiformis TaxID=265554 RepID=A0A7S3L7V9_9STRA